MITSKNLPFYMSKPHYIDIPRVNLLITLIVHGLIIHTSILAMYSFFMYAAMPLFAWEVFYSVYFLQKLWKMVGYSSKTLFAIETLFVLLSFVTADMERNLIWMFLQLVFFKN